MLKEERLKFILQRVNTEGRAATNELKEELGVSEDTIRKDFQELSRTGKVIRVHGGVLRSEDTVVDFNVRAGHHASEKMILASRAAELLRDKHVLYIDSGTTNLRLAEAILPFFTGTCITNSPAIALQLCGCPGADVILLGGSLQKTTKVVMGSQAISQLAGLHIECSVIGVSSLSSKHGITLPLQEETYMKQAAIRQSKEIIVIATKEKLGSISAFYCADLSVINHMITNETDPDILEPYIRNGIDVIPVDTSAQSGILPPQ